MAILLDRRSALEQAAASLLRFKRVGVKAAEMGDDNDDSDFEGAFSNIAHSFIREAAPALAKFEIGFQLLDRSKDDNKAVGIFGFKAGPQWLYVPIFYIDGEIKGHEILYLKADDRFVPLNEKWVNYILNRRPLLLGRGVERNPWKLGITPPDLQSFARPPIKYGMAIRPELLHGVQAFAHCSLQNPFKQEDSLSLPAFLKRAGKDTLKALLLTFQDYPKVAAAFQKVYGDLSIIKEAVEAAKTDTALFPLSNLKLKARDKPAATKPVGVLDAAPPVASAASVKSGRELEVVTAENLMIHTDLSPAEREELFRNGVTFRDKREKNSLVYRVETKNSLTNPTETGIYDMLVRPSSFERCLVIIFPHSHNGRKTFCTVVRLEGEKNWLNTHSTNVWVRQRTQTMTEFSDYVKGLPEPETLPVSQSAVHVLLGDIGEGTCPFEVYRDASRGGDIKSYYVDFKDYGGNPRADHLPRLPRQRNRYGLPDYKHDNESMIHLTGKQGGFLKILSGGLYVPKGYRLLTITSDRDDDDYNEPYMGPCCSRSSDPPPIVPGTIVDLQEIVQTKTAELKITNSGGEVRVNNGEPTSQTGALIHLVRDHGLGQEKAALLLKEAEKEKVLRCRIKYAVPSYMLQQTAPSAPGWPEPTQGTSPFATPGIDVQYPMERYIPADYPKQRMERWGYMLPPQPSIMEAAVTAAESGQKEVFDSAMIGSLLSSTQPENLDADLPQLLKALDKLCRRWFSFCWHGEEFQERYGKSSMPELEDKLKNAIDSLGDVTLFLQQKTTEPYPEQGSPDLNESGRN
jgi:hypothetical protein